MSSRSILCYLAESLRYSRTVKCQHSREAFLISMDKIIYAYLGKQVCECEITITEIFCADTILLTMIRFARFISRESSILHSREMSVICQNLSASFKVFRAHRINFIYRFFNNFNLIKVLIIIFCKFDRVGRM